MAYKDLTPEQRKASNRRGYAKKLGLTVEELDAKQAKDRELRSQSLRQRAIDHANRPRKKRSGGPKTCLDPIWEQLKKKHAKWAGTRLEKSIKPPEFLDSDRGREVRRSKQVEQ